MGQVHMYNFFSPVEVSILAMRGLQGGFLLTLLQPKVYGLMPTCTRLRSIERRHCGGDVSKVVVEFELQLHRAVQIYLHVSCPYTREYP